MGRVGGAEENDKNIFYENNFRNSAGKRTQRITSLEPHLDTFVTKFLPPP